MRVINRINNNVVLVEEENQKMIVTGKGVGFQVYPDNIVNKDFVEQRFILEKDTNNDYYIQLLKDIPMEYLNISKMIVENAEIELKKSFPPNFSFTLADHLNFVIERQKKNIVVNHLLSDEIKLFYPKEYEIGKKAVLMIKEEIKFDISPSEALSIALHLVNAAGGLSDKYDVIGLTETMKEIVSKIENYLNLKLDQSCVWFSRFITHLRFYLIRQLNFEIDDLMNCELLEIVKEKYIKAYKCAEIITSYVDKKYNYQTHDSEKLYLTLHINRLLNNQVRSKNEY